MSSGRQRRRSRYHVVAHEGAHDAQGRHNPRRRALLDRAVHVRHRQGRAFYGELFGWTSEDAGEEYGGYINFSKDGVQVAGCMKQRRSSGTPDVWSIYLATDDAEATVDGATANGGQVIVPAMEVMELGTMAVVDRRRRRRDRRVAARPAQGFGVRPSPARPAWFELHTRDYDATVELLPRRVRVGHARRRRRARVPLHDLGEGDAAARRHHGRDRRSCPRACRRTGRCTSASRTPTPRWPRSSSSAARSSAGRGHALRPARDGPRPHGARRCAWRCASTSSRSRSRAAAAGPCCAASRASAPGRRRPRRPGLHRAQARRWPSGR